ncbi:MAG: pilus assembly protein PilP [Acidobacteria bacterium]|nr:pilus assembly protein PilP [Acidobacteriota bacterium]
MKSKWIMAAAIVAAWLCGTAAVAGQTRVAAGSYDAGGRRDPFVSLIVPKAAPTAPRAAAAPRPGAGLSGIAVSDVQLKGVVRSGTTFVAILEGPDGRTFLAKRADRLMDGVIKGIEAGAVVFTERVEDAAGAVRQRDVRKALKAATVPGGQS